MPRPCRAHAVRALLPRRARYKPCTTHTHVDRAAYQELEKIRIAKQKRRDNARAEAREMIPKVIVESKHPKVIKAAEKVADLGADVALKGKVRTRRGRRRNRRALLGSSSQRFTTHVLK